MQDASARCPACGAEGQRANFCTRCGSSMTGRAARIGRPAAPETRLVACPFCGATNAASRRRCGRCGRDPHSSQTPLETRVEEPERAEAPAPERQSSATIAIVVVLAGLAMLGVLATILSARGMGPFPGAPDRPAEDEPVTLPVERAFASSELPDEDGMTFAAGNVLDDDPETAWQEAAEGEGIGEWIELELAEETELGRIIMANGWQRGEQFRRRARVAKVRIWVGDRPFTADLLDVRGVQAVDFPRPVTTDRVRIEILELHPGARERAAGFSVIRLQVPPEG